ncbi:hypothetical protein TPY_3190 [Sulfobacillus acidophilus TPY]|nr:hypothetical protein TPY_3190 [Sulfobacillus acidophilus TPY]
MMGQRSMIFSVGCGNQIPWRLDSQALREVVRYRAQDLRQ